MKSRLPLVVDNIVLAEDECGLNSDGQMVDVWYGAGVLRGLDYMSYVSGGMDDIPSGQLRIEFNRDTRTVSYTVLRKSPGGCFSVSAKLSAHPNPNPNSRVSAGSGPTAVGSFCSSGIYLCE